MKSVGIITMHRPDNYGSYLQTFATYKFISDMGYDVRVIDYAYPTEYHKSIISSKEQICKKTKPSFVHRKITGLFRRILHIDLQEHLEKMQNFYRRNVRFTKRYNSGEELSNDPPNFDIYVTGSDQVWNPEYTGTDTSFLLSWAPKEKKRIAFSASFAIKQLPECVKDIYASNLKQYQSIGIREQSDILKELGGIKGELVLDPTFLYNKAQWIKITGNTPLINRKYILCYLLTYKYNPFPYAYKVIKKLQSTTGFGVVIIDGDPADTLRGWRVVGNLGPEDFVCLFANASYIITSSFHGTAFAINFEKPFFTIVDNCPKSNDNRQLSLVNEFEIPETNILVNNINIKNMEVNFNIGWHERLESLRLKSKNFLKEALSTNE